VTSPFARCRITPQFPDYSDSSATAVLILHFIPDINQLIGEQDARQDYIVWHYVSVAAGKVPGIRMQQQFEDSVQWSVRQTVVRGHGPTDGLLPTDTGCWRTYSKLTIRVMSPGISFPLKFVDLLQLYSTHIMLEDCAGNARVFRAQSNSSIRHGLIITNAGLCHLIAFVLIPYAWIGCGVKKKGRNF